jgi:hypothetical protein
MDKLSLNTIQDRLMKRIRFLLIFFMIALALSGITAIPLIWEIELLNHFFGTGSFTSQFWPGMSQWITFIYQGLTTTNQSYPFIQYGTDWLAFAHIVIAIAFLGPLRDPVRNIWVVEFGLIACVLIIPTAVFFGALRGIPVFWRIIDCSFGVFGFIPLWIVRRDILALMNAVNQGG